MSVADIVAPALFASFGLWWVILPQSVIRFYHRFHGGRVRLPSPFAIRCIGIGWIILIGSIMFFTTKPQTGTGLGLGMVRKLVALHDGTIELETEVGRGTTFTVSFDTEADGAQGSGPTERPIRRENG